jgi:translation initiation factor 6
MHFSLDFEGNPDIGAYVKLTNKYIVLGRSTSPNVINFFRENFDCPVIETTINTIKTVGTLCVGNSNGLILPDTCTEQELQHIRNSLPASIKVVRMVEKLNALGNVMVCNDYACLVHPEVDDQNIAIIEEVLGVPVFKHMVGAEPLVGTFSVLTNQGMLTCPNITEVEMKELSELLKVQVIAGTVNSGSNAVGGGIIANDYVCITGSHCTNVEIKVAEAVFNLVGSTPVNENAAIDEIVI